MTRMYTFQVRYNCTIINTSPMKFKPRSQFGIVISNVDAKDILVNFSRIVVAAGVSIRTSRNEELDTIPMYEITSPLFCDLSRRLHTKNEMDAHQGTNISISQRMIIYRGEQHKGEAR